VSEIPLPGTKGRSEGTFELVPASSSSVSSSWSGSSSSSALKATVDAVLLVVVFRISLR